ncbi:MAG: ATP-binding protein [bacterium]|nr:ATP-binding protein [bacterium]
MRVAEGKKQPQTLKELQDLFEVVSEGKRVWETTFDAVVDPVLIVDREYNIQRANLAAAASAEVDVRDLVLKKCYAQFAKRESPCPGCPMMASHQKHAHKRKGLNPFADGREFVASAFPITGKQGEDLGLAVMQYQDMSAIRKLEAQLVQNEKMAALGAFASGVAHDINNPLSGVLAFAQLAMQGLDKESQTFQDLKEIETSALRCKKIVENLLLFSKPLREDDRNHVDLGEIVRKVLPNLQVQWNDSSYQLTVKLEKLSPVFVSEAKFEQVFTNLLSNAYQAIQDGGEITIYSGEESNMVYVDITDNGTGISSENLKKIFDPYFTTKAKGGGTGLGLPTTYNIVREHGGRIKVKSELGRGSSFRVFVPKGGQS